jgi:hypothetical protein
MAATENQDDARTLHDPQIYTALGLFLLFFALVVFISIFFTDTRIGKLTDLGAGIIIGGIGGGMLLKGLRSGRNRSQSQSTR